MRTLKELLRPEEELFLLLARSVLGPEHQRRAAEIVNGKLNWAQFVALCRRFRLSHLIAYSLKSFNDAGAVPPVVYQKLNTFLWSATARNQFGIFGRELPSILRTFDEAGVQVMLLKGPVIALFHYSNQSLRLFGDLDFLVRPDALDEAAGVLMKAGFVVPPSKQQDQSEASAERKTYPPLIRRTSPNQSITVDLHWKLSDNVQSNEDRIWELAERHELGKRSLLVPAVEHRLYHVALHAADHGFFPHVWNGSHLTMQCVCDIGEILRSSGENFRWSEFEQLSLYSGIGPYCYNYLKLAEHLLGVVVPSETYENLLSDQSNRYTQSNWDRIAAEFVRVRPDDVSRYAYNFLMRRDVSWTVRWKRIRKRCFPPVASVARYYGVSERSFIVKYACYLRRLLRPSIVKKGLLLSIRITQMLMRKALIR